LLVFGAAPAWVADLDSDLDLGVVALDGQALDDAEGLAQRRYDARPGTVYLLRPDGHVAHAGARPPAAVKAAMAARWPGVDPMLITDPNLERPDDFYEALLDAHQGLSTAQSHDLNARLVLLLANQVGRLDVLKAGAAGGARQP
jgi:hypothetical protein